MTHPTMRRDHRYPCPVSSHGQTFWAHSPQMLENLLKMVARWSPDDRAVLSRYTVRGETAKQP